MESRRDSGAMLSGLRRDKWSVALLAISRNRDATRRKTYRLGYVGGFADRGRTRGIAVGFAPIGAIKVILACVLLATAAKVAVSKP
jgi:hypothetical protein